MRTTESRRGVALIVVLGMLSLLMIMGVAFSVSMRVERSGAGNYAGGVLSRQLVHAALADAIERIDLEMTDNAAYPDWDILTSDPGGVFKTSVELGWGEALDHVPAVFHKALSETNCYWLDGTANEGVIGRRAYTIINCSGLLNANKVGGKVRDMGFSPDEIQLDGLPDFDLPGDVSRFRTERDDQKPYDSVNEMLQLNTGFGASNHNFVVNSVAGLVPNVVYLSSNMAEWVQADIERGLRNSGVVPGAGVTGQDLARAYRNLRDYVDEDSIPGGPPPGRFDECGGEAVPMINEVLLTYVIDRTGATATHQYSLDIECFYPFAEQSSENFVVEYSVTFSSADSRLQFAPKTETKPLNLIQPHSYGLINFTLEPPKPITGLNATEPMNISFTANIRAKVKLGPSGQDVDLVPAPYTLDGVVLRVEIPNLQPVASAEKQVWAECIDPRFNWATGQQQGAFDQWVYSADLEEAGLPGYTAESTIGADNSYVKWLFSHPKEVGWNYDADNFADGTWAHVANRPLKSVGELGYICIRPWYSIRLYDHREPNKEGNDPTYHKVLDHFTLYPDKVTTSRGLVNVNTYMTNVLGAVFNKMPFNEYDPNPAQLSRADAMQIADAIWLAGPYTNLSDLGRIDLSSGAPLLSVLPAAPMKTREITKEAIIRNSAGLLTTRQNLFTILLAGGPFARGVGVVASKGTMGDWLGTQRAVAVVWRDTFPEDNDPRKPHPVALLYFKWIDD